MIDQIFLVIFLFVGSVALAIMTGLMLCMLIVGIDQLRLDRRRKRRGRQ